MKQILNKQERMRMILIFAGFVLCMGAHAQTITYAYDASGNCTSRFLERSAETGLPDMNSEDSNRKDVSSNADEAEQQLTEENSITVYPNPSNGQFQIELKGYDDALGKGMMTIYSAQGQVVFKISPLQPINTVSINNQPIGTYVIHFILYEKLVTHKVIIEK